MSVRAAKRKMKVVEFPVDEPPRIGGEPKLQIWKWGGLRINFSLLERCSSGVKPNW